MKLIVDALRDAILIVSARHDWANTTDTEDRTEEIAAEYDDITSVTIGPIEHTNSLCQKDGCTCWCQACERHNWRHKEGS